MKVLALNATYRPTKTTTRLTQSALEGAASVERQPLLEGRRMAMILSSTAIRKAKIKEETKKV